MSSLSMVEAKLPPGFRFHPKDEELICDYLMKKVMITSSNEQPPLLMEVDLNNCEPWDIPQTTSVGGKDRYFYSHRDRKYATGLRTNRATISGYWKATGKDRAISRKGSLVGMRKTLVFYQGRAPKGMKTEWVMHEFRLEGPLASPQLSSHKGDWVLCRVFHKINKELHRNQTILGNNDQNHYNNNTILRSSLYLSPLMEPYITFDQQTNFIGDQYEQVPCLSSFNLEHIIEPNFGDNYIPDNIGTYNSSMSSSSNCDNNVSEVVLNHLTKMETNKLVTKESPSFGEGSSESFLSEDIMPTMWVNQY